MSTTKGITDFKDNSKEKKIEITFDDEKISIDAIVKAIEGAGFRVLGTDFF